nr:PREDICTED: uncharacterized protein LOC108212706 [Daucus carota subsp. sativus]
MSASTPKMSSSLKHFSHPKHSLVLKDFNVVGDDARCHVCDTSVVGSLTYTCSRSSDDAECQGFYLHKRCAELPTTITFYKHNQHPLVLIKRPNHFCDVCGGDLKFSYACDDCRFDVCLICAFQQRLLHHQGHPEHPLILMPRKSLFKCDACYEKAEDSSYVCTTCDLCIHKKCAFSPLTIPTPAFHHHPLHLFYSIPTMHRYFDRFCNICRQRVHKRFWMYYCHKCTYFVHMRCATSSPTSSSLNEIEDEGSHNDEADLIELPLHSEESLFDLIISQCRKLQFQFQGKDKNSTAISPAPDPPIINKHWSHKEHPLVRFQHSSHENDNNEDNYNKRELICDGCIQPITVIHPSYYACNQCGFLLHSFCATQLPGVLVAGACPPHPQHSIELYGKSIFYTSTMCEFCRNNTYGFYYQSPRIFLIYTQVTGELFDHLSSLDALRAALPVGTVSGAPKVKAMELIDKFEVTRRGPYSGGFGDDAICHVCDTSVIGSPTYTCSRSSDDAECQGFYLHKSCAELPTTITFYKHNQHPLVLLKHPHQFCDSCGEDFKFS